MPRFLPMVLTITILPLLLLVCTAVYVGGHFAAANTFDNESQRSETNEIIDEWIDLFDGTSFKDWEGNKKHFRIENGSIIAGNLKTKIPNNEFLCTEKKFKNFELRLKAKLIGQGKNAGIQFRSKRIPNHHEVIGYQCDMGQMKGHSIWGYLYDESRRRKFLVQADPKKTDENTKVGDWNEIVIRCENKRIQIWVNDFRTVNYVEMDKDIDQNGIIGLQIHSGPAAEAWYREIKIKQLN